MIDGKGMVGVTGFELATLCSQSRCSTRLSYTPTEPHSLAGSHPDATESDGIRDKFLIDQVVERIQPTT